MFIINSVEIKEIIMLVMGVVVLFLIFRAFWLWYWKINKIVKTLDRILNILEMKVGKAKNEEKIDGNNQKQ